MIPGPFRIKPFYGLHDGFEDPSDFIEDIETIVDRDYFRETEPIKDGEAPERSEATKELQDRKDRDCRQLFRQNVTGRAEIWYNYLDRSIKKDWKELKKACLTRYQIEDVDPFDEVIRMEEEYDAMRQGPEEPLYKYLERADDFHARYGSKKEHFGARMIRGLRDVAKRDMLQFHLRYSSRRDYAVARKLISDAYSDEEDAQPVEARNRPPANIGWFDETMRETLPVMLNNIEHLLANSEKFRQ